MVTPTGPNSFPGVLCLYSSCATQSSLSWDTLRGLATLAVGSASKSTMATVSGDTPVTFADLANLNLNYTLLVPYNGSISTGGNSLTDNLNLFYTVSDPTLLSRFQKCRLNAIWAVWRYRVDRHLGCVGLAHDSGCWVGTDFFISIPNLSSLISVPPVTWSLFLLRSSRAIDTLPRLQYIIGS